MSTNGITTDQPYNPRDLSVMRVDQSFIGGSVKQLLTDITVRKPKADEWVRVHPEYRITTRTLRLSSKPQEIYYVVPCIAAKLERFCRTTVLYVAINSQGVLFVWHVNVDNPDRSNDYLTSGHLAAESALREWIQVSANMAAGRYDIFQPESAIPDPLWPELTFQEIIDAAFRRTTIDSEEHAVVNHLRGRV